MFKFIVFVAAMAGVYMASMHFTPIVWHSGPVVNGTMVPWAAFIMGSVAIMALRLKSK
jgi:hypothetical protein